MGSDFDPIDDDDDEIEYVYVMAVFKLPERELCLRDAQVGCSRIMDAREMAENSHYKLLDVHVEWEDQQMGKRVKGVDIVPKSSKTPGKTWRGSVSVGHDNELVYHDLLGMEAQMPHELSRRGVI